MRDTWNCEPAYIKVYGTELSFEVSEYKDSIV